MGKFKVLAWPDALRDGHRQQQLEDADWEAPVAPPKPQDLDHNTQLPSQRQMLVLFHQLPPLLSRSQPLMPNDGAPALVVEVPKMVVRIHFQLLANLPLERMMRGALL